MFSFKKSAYPVFIASLAIIVGVFLWAGISGTRLLGDGKEAYAPEGNSGPRDRASSGAYHQFYHK